MRLARQAFMGFFPSQVPVSTERKGGFPATAAMLVVAIVVAVFSHVVTCVADDDHVSVAARADQKAIAAVSVRTPDPDAAGNGTIANAAAVIALAHAQGSFWARSTTVLSRAFCD